MFEVSLVHDESSRFVLAKNVPLRHLEECLLLANEYLEHGTYPHPWWKQAAVMAVRMDWSREALYDRWEATFYKLTTRKDGVVVHRRRFPLAQIEKDWIQMVKDDKAAVRGKRKVEVAGNKRSEYLA